MARQDNLFDTREASVRKPHSVECLGMTFENDEARRAYFLLANVGPTQ